MRAIESTLLYHKNCLENVDSQDYDTEIGKAGKSEHSYLKPDGCHPDLLHMCRMFPLMPEWGVQISAISLLGGKTWKAPGKQPLRVKDPIEQQYDGLNFRKMLKREKH